MYSNKNLDLSEDEEKKLRIEFITKRFEILKKTREIYTLVDPNELLTPKEEAIIKDYFENKFNLDFTKPLDSFKFTKGETTGEYDLDEYKFNKTDIESFVNTNFSFDKNVYLGYNEKTNFKRILIVSHSGTIMELFNVISRCKGLNILSDITHTTNTGLSIIKIYCPECDGVCTNKSDKCSVEFDYVLTDDANHLKDLK